jgi:hypothetical protein
MGYDNLNQLLYSPLVIPLLWLVCVKICQIYGRMADQ